MRLAIPLAILLCATPLSAEKSVFILNTTDIHSKMEDRPDEFGRTSNLLRLSTALRERMSALGRDRTLLIDCGDTFQGSLPASKSSGELGLLFLLHRSYDVWVPGNHDFDFGIARFEELAGKADGVAVLALNVKSRHCRAWRMFERNGARIVVIGATLPYLEFFNMAAAGVGGPGIAEGLDRMLPEIMKERPAAIVMAMHQGVFSPSDRGGESIAKIAGAHPQINLFLGGHTHEDNPGQKIGPASWFVEAGCHARTFAEIEMVFDDEGRRLLDIKSRLVDVSAKIAEDMELKSKMSGILSESDELGSRMLGETAFHIPSVDEGVVDCEIRELVSSAICASAGAEIAFSGCGTRIAGFAGRISYGGVFRLLPYEDNVCTLNLAPGQFKAVLEEQVARFDPRHFNMPWGLRCALDKDGRMLSARDPGGAEWTEGRRKVAFSSFALSGSGGRFPVLAKFARDPDCGFHDSGVKVRDAVASFISKNSPLRMKTAEWISRRGK